MPFEYEERLNKIRLAYPKAYEHWSKDEDILLRTSFEVGADIEDLSRLFQRQPSAIRSRLRKIGLQPHYTKQSVTVEIDSEQHGANQSGQKFEAEFSFEWNALLCCDEERYFFPEPMTSFMRHQYSKPAAYRWIVFGNDPLQLVSVYIGSAKRLCPDRLSAYLKPKDSPTNCRLNKQFHQFLQRGLKVGLEVLDAKITVSGVVLRSINLSVNQTRLFVESLLIAYYRQVGVTLLNL